VVPDQAPEARLRAIGRPGAPVLEVPCDNWRDIIVTSRADGVDGLFVHPAQDRAVTAGHAMIGLEIRRTRPTRMWW
jgi:threonine dehydratase